MPGYHLHYQGGSRHRVWSQGEVMGAQDPQGSYASKSLTSGFLRALTGYHKHTAGQKACGSFRIFWPLVSISGVCQHIVCSRNRPKNESNLQMGPIFHSCLSHNRRFWGILSGPSSPPEDSTGPSARREVASWVVFEGRPAQADSR